MNRKQVLVNLGIVAVLCVISVICYHTGKAYDLILENVPYTLNGKDYPAIEAMQATIDDTKNPFYLLEGDRVVGMAVGSKHRLKIEILDENDKVIESAQATFTMRELGKDMSLNVARLYHHVTLKTSF